MAPDTTARQGPHYDLTLLVVTEQDAQRVSIIALALSSPVLPQPSALYAPIATTVYTLLTVVAEAARQYPRNPLESAQLLKHQHYPANATDVKSIVTPNNLKIGHKEPGKAGVCETTPGVNSYAGYIDLAPNVHTFFWFFESRRDPANDPITLWLNGGPGSDSLISLLKGLGPCRSAENLTSYISEHSWSEVSNMLFLSQPVGTGLSYQEEAIGRFNLYTGGFANATMARATGRYPILDPFDQGTIDRTDLAAIATWSVVRLLATHVPPKL
ncbi:hypothetical protein LTR95_012271 [Oleoguttula sp. CCFEE 5521]